MHYSNTVMKNRLNNVQIMRIIACFGVFFGHFAGMTLPSEQLTDLLTLMRNGFLSATPAAWFYMGDLDVLFFFSAGGFFLSYTFNDQTDAKTTALKLLDRLCSLFIPAVLITVVFAGLKILVSGNAQEVKAELTADLIKILRGIYEGSYEPTLSYQLWYIHFMARGCVLGLGINYLFRKHRALREALTCLLICVFWWRNMNGLWQVATGVLAGNLLKDIQAKDLQVKQSAVFACGIVSLAVVPFVYSMGGLKNELLAMLLTGVFLVCDALAESGTVQRAPGAVMKFLEKNNYSFYLLHVFALVFFTVPVYCWLMEKVHCSENIVLQLCFLMTGAVTLILSELFSRYLLPLFKASRWIPRKIGNKE